MNEFSICYDDHEESFWIKHENHISYIKIEEVFQFYSRMRLGLEEKNGSYQVRLGHLLLDKKNTVLLNLMDFSTLFEFLSGARGSLMADHVYGLLEDVDVSLEERINTLLEEMVSPVWKNIINYSFSFDIIKYLKANTNFSFPNLEDIYTCLEEIIKKNSNINYFVFYHSAFWKKDFEADNLYCFDLNANVSLTKKNILILKDSYRNLDIDLLSEEVLRQFPDFMEKESLYCYLDCFFRYYFSNSEEIISDDEKMLVLAKIIFQLFGYQYNIRSKKEMNNMFKSFLST